MEPPPLPWDIKRCHTLGRVSHLTRRSPDPHRPRLPHAERHPTPPPPSREQREMQQQPGVGKSYFIRKLKSDTKAALSRLPTCTRVPWSSVQREVSFLPLRTSPPTLERTTASAAQLVLLQDAHELLRPSVRSRYSCSVNALWGRRAISPRKLLSWVLQPPSPAKSPQTPLGAQILCTPCTERTTAPCHTGPYHSRNTLLHEKPGVEDTPLGIGQAAKGKSRFSHHWHQGGDVGRATFGCHHPTSNRVPCMQPKGRALKRPRLRRGTHAKGLSKFCWSGHTARRG